MLPPIHFYLPDPVPADMPQSPDVYWADFGKYMRGGVYAWTVQTYLRLRDAGVNCHLVAQIPSYGILVTHRKSVPPDFFPPPGVLFVCLRADATFHPFAHLHVVINELALNRWYPSVFMPHWPQPGLIPRDPTRGDRYENVAFYGHPGCIAGETRGDEWDTALKELGLQYHFVPQEKWHDFSDVDVIVAVRDFIGHHRHGNKPPTKLFNAWHAGVPAILGRESAYEQQRKDALDYLEVTSFAELVAALRELRNKPELRHAIVKHGFVRAKESDPKAIAARWQTFFETMAETAYRKWRHAGFFERQLFRCSGFLKQAAQAVHKLAWR